MLLGLHGKIVSPIEKEVNIEQGRKKQFWEWQIRCHSEVEKRDARPDYHVWLKN
jgi:hypothetical protein